MREWIEFLASYPTWVKVIVALSIAINVILLIVFRPEKKDSGEKHPTKINYTGTVTDENSFNNLRGAKVSLDYQGVHKVAYTDTEGLFAFSLEVKDFPLPAKIRVEHSGYNGVERNVQITTINESESIQLSPTTTLTPSPTTSQADKKKPANQTSHQERVSDRDFAKLMDTLGSLVRFEAGQAPIHFLLSRHCEDGRVQPTGQLLRQSSLVLENVREIRRSLSTNYPSDFVLKKFKTFRQLVLDLEQRENILKSIASDKSGKVWNPSEFCEMAVIYKKLHERLSAFQEDYRKYLLEQRANQ